MYTPELNNILTYYAWKLTGRHDVDDLVQTTYVRIYQNREKLEGGNIGAWACKVLHNEFINQCREKKKHIDESVDTAIKLESQFNPESELNVLYIKKQIDKLPGKLRSIFIDRFEGYSYNELCEKYNVPLNSIKSYIYRARQILQKTA